MLMKLLATKMVANSFFGRSNSLEMILKCLALSSKPESISDFDNEKRATSAPEINAEQSNKIKSKTSPEIKETFTLSIKTIKLAGSGSKVNNLV